MPDFRTGDYVIVAHPNGEKVAKILGESKKTGFYRVAKWRDVSKRWTDPMVIKWEAVLRHATREECVAKRVPVFGKKF